MFRKKIKKVFTIWFLAVVIFFVGSKTSAQTEPIFLLSLNWQKTIRGFWLKIFPPAEDSYKEKYYELLQELAKLKLALNQIKETEIISNQKKYLPNLVEAEIFKVDSLGYLYTERKTSNPGTVVLDKNWALVGKVTQVSQNYSTVATLNMPGIEFNAMNLDGQLLGLARTISNGFLEINFVDPKIEIKLNDFVLTYGDDNFPAGFLVGTVAKINKTQIGQQLIVKLAFDLDSGKIYFVK
jgi:cell shape-determining protein MreC